MDLPKITASSKAFATSSVSNAATPTPITARTFGRQFKAEPGINIEKFGANHYNGSVARNALEIFVSVADAFHRDTSESRSGIFEYRERELGRLNEVIYSLLTGSSPSHVVSHQFCDGSRVDVSIEQTNKGVQVKMGSDSYLIEDMTLGVMKKMLESQTIGHPFSKAVLAGCELQKNPTRFIEVLAKSRTVTGAEIKDTRKTVDGITGNWVIPTITKIPCPGITDGSVSIHIGNNYIATPNKLTHVDDGGTVAYVDDMCVIAAVDGWGPNANHECSRVHSALISAAALRTVQDLRNGLIKECDLKKAFDRYMMEFYFLVAMPEGDTGVTFAGGVTYLNERGELKLFSFGFSSALFASANAKGETTPYHVQKETVSKPCVKKDDYKDLMKYSKTALCTIDPSATEIKLGTDGCFSKYASEIPGDYDKTVELVDLQCGNFSAHGEISPDFTDEALLRTKLEQNAQGITDASGKMQRVLAKPKLIAEKMGVVITSRTIGTVWSTLNDNRQSLPLELEIPTQETVQTTIGGLKNLQRIKEIQGDKNTPLSDLLENSTQPDGSQKLAWKNGVEKNDVTQPLLFACDLVMKAYPKSGLLTWTVNEVLERAQLILMKPVSIWKTMIQESTEEDTAWRALATGEGQLKHAHDFQLPSAKSVKQWENDYNTALLRKNQLEVNQKALGGDDFIFISWLIPAMRNELLLRKQQMRVFK